MVGGARGVMDTAIRVQILDDTDCISHSAIELLVLDCNTLNLKRFKVLQSNTNNSILYRNKRLILNYLTVHKQIVVSL